jgi:hypothetical protein
VEPEALVSFWQSVKAFFSPGPTPEEELEYHERVDRLFGRALELKVERDDLLRACKLLLCIHYGHWGPLGEGDIARFANRLVEKADGRPFDPKAWIIEAAQRIRLED